MGPIQNDRRSYQRLHRRERITPFVDEETLRGYIRIPVKIIATIISDSRENEIADAILSAVDHVDEFLIVDTGISDSTVERAREATGNKRLHYVRYPWTNSFSAARNKGICTAKEELSADWILILDTDERMQFGIDLRRELRRAEEDVLLTYADDLSYVKEKLIRAKCLARYEGPTHEALIGGKKRGLLRGVTFAELPKTEEQLRKKFLRDIDLLRTHVDDHGARDPRWFFYLGCCFEALGEPIEAIEHFGICAQARGSGPEAAWARYKQAEIQFTLGEFDRAIRKAAVGIAADPAFAECACIAGEACLALDRKEDAAAWARMAISIGRYEGKAPERLWFRDLPSLYERPYRILEQATGLCTAYVPATRARLHAMSNINDLEQLSVSRSAPASAREDARKMLSAANIAFFCPSVKHQKIFFDPPDGLLPMNPSICWHADDMWCVIRAVNYTMKGRQYVVHDPGGVVRSKNYLGQLDPRGFLVNVNEILDHDESPRFSSKIVGYEDIRLVGNEAHMVPWASATVCDRHPDGGRRVAMLVLSSTANVKRAEVQPSNQIDEKNWMPLNVNGQLTWIYSLDPTAILPGPLNKCRFALDHLRGGAATQYRSGYLCVTHEVVEHPNGRDYLHRFVKLDKKFNVVAVSKTWCFQKSGVEFCAGIVCRGGKITLSYGRDDREAWMAIFAAKDLEKMEWMTP